jgi:hypothetical protein
MNTKEQQRAQRIAGMILLLHHDDGVFATCDFAKSKWYSNIFCIDTNGIYCSSYTEADDGENSAQTE